ncbi:CBL-interacting protein kinase 2-like [Lycium ferocissimum]|uniref:CBL-interacting protein kinase 2-like n=1 Tax=Lycium ferocissimum TaxID=112874 RepID=UPI0028151192|nr:CBL-interacting protein kinase 2-like [Lycium ferocissimum]
MAKKESILMERYELGRLLGQGTFAKVFYARNIKTGQGVAIKVIDKEKVLRVGLMNQIKREISVMRLVRHPNIVHLYEVMATKTKIYFVMEYAKGGELFNKVARGKLKEDIARKYFQQLINAVDFCHSRGVYHRDLKPENLLLDENENLKISDFGLSALVESKHQDGLLHTTCGTPAYVAPEVINRKGYDGAKADIWSCGVVLFVLLAGYLPFEHENLMEMYRKIGKAEFKCPSWFPPEARRLLWRMLDPNPSTRISLAKIRGSSWFKKGISVSSKSTVVDEVSSTEEPCLKKDEVAAWIPKLNAFDIISLYAKFDLSKLFEEPCLKKEAKFTSWKPASVIISKLENIAKRLKLKVSKRGEGLLRFEGTKEGRKGILCIDVEIFEVVEAFHLVEVKKSNGDTMEYQQILNQGLRPGLQDIVWTWQDDQQPEQSEEQLNEQPNSQLQQQKNLDNQQQPLEQQQQQQQLLLQKHVIQQEQLP